MHINDEVRSRVEAKLAAGYPQLKVQVRSARVVPNEGIEVRGVYISDPRVAGQPLELARFDELSLTCNTDLTHLARGEPEFSKIVIRRALIRATRSANGTWTTSALLPLPKFGTNSPPIEIESATVEIVDPARNQKSPLTLRDIFLSLKPAKQEMVGQQPAFHIEGTLTGDHADRISFRGLLEPSTSRLVLEGAAESIRLSPELLAKLPGNVPQCPSLLQPLRGNVRVDFRLQHDVQKIPALQFDVACALAGGRITDPRLPYPITEIRGNARVNNAGFVIEELSAQGGPTLVRCKKIQGVGYGPDCQIRVEMEAGGVRLEKRLSDALPDRLRQAWYKFLPEGDVDILATFDYQNGKWTPDATVTCRNVSFSFYKFPYRLEQAKGTVQLVGNKTTLQLSAKAGSQPLWLTGEFLNPGPQFTGWIKIDGDSIAVDDRLVAALPDKPREVVRSLNPQGAVGVSARMWRDAVNEPVHKFIQLTFSDCAITYNKFPYPVTRINGGAEMHDDQWVFSRLRGVNDTASITCDGHLRPIREGTELSLHFTGERVPLEEELWQALPPNMQRLWSSLEPRGEVKLESADVTYLSAQRQMSVSVVAEPSGDARSTQSTSIRPVAFPYRMENLRGKIHYRDGHAELTEITAEHGLTKLASHGKCDFLSDGSWSLSLNNFSVIRARADNDLLTALPGSLKRAITQLNPSGPVNLRGNVAFSRPGHPEAELQTQWDVVADMSQMNLDCGVRLENMHGSIGLTGSSEGERFVSRGQLSLDSLTYKNFQFTEIMGPFYVDNARVLFGAWTEAPRANRQAPRVTAKLCQGILAGDAQVVFAAVPQYVLQGQVVDASLQQVIGEHLSSKLEASGRMLANVELRGSGKGTHTLQGRGNIRLVDADIYELPVMVSMLKILSIKQPDATAFTKSNIDFRVQGEHVLFDKINFNGDAVSLLGKGQMNFDRQLDLTFHAVVGRDDSNFQVPILSNVLREASQQIMEIRVVGSCDDPITRSQAFPGVNQALQALQAEMQGNSRPPVAREALLPR
jgi:hypothetical protein